MQRHWHWHFFLIGLLGTDSDDLEFGVQQQELWLTVDSAGWQLQQHEPDKHLTGQVMIVTISRMLITRLNITFV